MNDLSNHGKERIVIKNTLFFISSNETLNLEFEAILSLLDVLINKSTARQCRVLHLKLLHFSEDAIAKELKVSQPVVNQHSSAIGWNAVEKALTYFNAKLKSQ